MFWLVVAAAGWLALVGGLLWVWRHDLRALWREPVFVAPILIVESDDWGAGPLAQADALDALVDRLAGHRDALGRHPVMTLAMILALPEAGDAHARRLPEPAVLAAIRRGQAREVFALQLHGLTHFWPPALAAATQAEVRAWLQAPECTETLPSALQSRWVDASVLPSQPLPREAVAAAVAEEVALYRELFGSVPEVVVPPTFVWTETVESAWAAAGVHGVITPGRRLTCRDGEGRPARVDRVMRNGDSGAGNIVYLVRDDYFEPALGHTPERALAALRHKTTLGRPCLLETHRSNFLAATSHDPTTGPAAALAALDALYARAVAEFPQLRFASCAELVRAISHADPAWIARSGRQRFTIWQRRIAVLPRFGKLARGLGLLTLFGLFAHRP